MRTIVDADLRLWRRLREERFVWGAQYYFDRNDSLGIESTRHPYGGEGRHRLGKTKLAMNSLPRGWRALKRR